MKWKVINKPVTCSQLIRSGSSVSPSMMRSRPSSITTPLQRTPPPLNTRTFLLPGPSASPSLLGNCVSVSGFIWDFPHFHSCQSSVISLSALPAKWGMSRLNPTSPLTWSTRCVANFHPDLFCVRVMMHVRRLPCFLFVLQSFQAHNNKAKWSESHLPCS